MGSFPELWEEGTEKDLLHKRFVCTQYRNPLPYGCMKKVSFWLLHHNEQFVGNLLAVYLSCWRLYPLPLKIIFLKRRGNASVACSLSPLSRNVCFLNK